MYKKIYARIARLVLRALLCAAVLCGVSCDLPEAPTAVAGTGTLTLILPGTRASGAAGSSRSVLRDSDIAELFYWLTLTYSSGGVVSLPAKAETTNISLKAGDWSIEAKAYTDDTMTTLVGSSTAPVPVTIIAGQDVSATIIMYVDPTYEAGLTEIYIHNEAELRRCGMVHPQCRGDRPAGKFRRWRVPFRRG
jgi:hypothetical protein